MKKLVVMAIVAGFLAMGSIGCKDTKPTNTGGAGAGAGAATPPKGTGK